MDEYKLCKIFFDVYSDSLDGSIKNCYRNFKIDDYETLENNLKTYLNYVLGYKLHSDYNDYIREIRKYFENIIVNAHLKNCLDISQFVLDYTYSFFEKINKRPLASIFIDALKKNYSPDFAGTVIGNEGNFYTVARLSRKEEEEIPSVVIKNIDNFESILASFVEKVERSSSYFNSFFKYMDHKEAISYLLEWVVKNATVSDMTNIEQYFKKYSDFITDNTFDSLIHPVKIGDFLGDELYVMRKRANVNYETPYYLSFMMKNDKTCVELPTVRMGIEHVEQEKIAHILATQTSQINDDLERYNELTLCFKRMLSKSKNFREFNPSHVISIILTFGVFKGKGIDKVIVEDYFPLRLQGLILENKRDDEELYDYQHRLTDKKLYNCLRLLEFFDGIEITDYTDNDNGLRLFLSDNIKSDNPFLQNLYNMGYKAGIKYKTSNVEEELKTK
jgi:hypothetical protein